ncbi:MAG: class I SAM-dependent methyltransferase [Polyangiales bacterium]
MLDNLPSQTSALVSFARAVSISKQRAVPEASTLMPKYFAMIAGDAPVSNARRTLLRAASLGLIDHVALRQAIIDTWIERTADFDQVVILGAGLDERAWRLPHLAGKTVFEIDHPATQAYKRRKADRLPKPLANIRFVDVDFERQLFAEELIHHGFDPSASSLILWEGVTMYLHREVVLETFRTIASLGTGPRRLITSYMVKNSLPFGALGRVVITNVFKYGGESLRASFEPAELHDLLKSMGYDVVDDSDQDDWCRLHGFENARPWKTFDGERVVVCDFPSKSRT